MSPDTARTLLEDAEKFRALARGLVRDADHADEVVQRAWLAALERPPHDSRHLSGWFKTVITHTARKLGRDRRRRARLDALAPDRRPPMATPDELLERAALHRRVVDAVVDLPERYRTVILLHYFEGLETRTIADRLDVSVETVRTRLGRARERLRTKLEAAPETRDWRLLALPLLPAREAGAALVTGALIMSIKSKLIVVVACLLAVGIWWGGWIPGESPTPGKPSASVPESKQSSASTPQNEVASMTPGRLGSPSHATTSQSLPIGESEGATPESPYVISGRAIGPDGEPAADVEVFLGRADEHRWLSEGWDANGTFLQYVDTQKPGLSSARTDDEGRFRFENLQAGVWGLAARHPELGLGFSPGVGLDADFPTAEQNVQLEGGVVLSGTVRDAETKAPLAEAGVRLSVTRTDDEGKVISRSWGVTLTDSEGRYRFPPLPFLQFQATGQAKGYTSRSAGRIEVDPRETERTIDFELQRARVLTGRIVDPGGKPSSLGRVLHQRTVTSAGPPAPVVVCLSASAPSTIDSFRLDVHRVGAVDLAEHRFEVELKSTDTESFVSLWYRESLLAETAVAADAEEVEIVVDVAQLPEEPHWVEVELRAIDANTGVPISEFTYETQELVRGFRSFVLDSKNGTGPGALLVEAGRRYRLSIDVNGYAGHRSTLGFDDDSTHEVIEVALRPATATLRGQVRTQAGEPLLAADVFVYDPASTPPLVVAHTLSDRDGLYEVAGLGVGDYWVAVDLKEWVPIGHRVTVDSETPTLDFELFPGEKFEFRVKNTPQGCALRVLGPEGLPVVDDNRNGTSRFGGGALLLDPRETYTIVLVAPDRKTIEQTLRIGETPKLHLQFEPE